MDKFVVDAGPFIHLEEINQIHLLKRLPSLLIPKSILSEISPYAQSTSLKSLNHWPNIEVIEVPKPLEPSLKLIAERAPLQRGERDCLTLALQIRPCIFLTDDLTARTVAEKLSIEVHGAVGLLAYAFRQKWLSLREAEVSLNLLYERSSLFITYGIIENAIRSLKHSV